MAPLIKIKSRVRLFGLYWLFVTLLYLIQLVMATFIPQYSGLIYTLSVGFAVCGALKLVEELLFPEIETNELLKNNPIAYAIYIFAFAYIFANAML